MFFTRRDLPILVKEGPRVGIYKGLPIIYQLDYLFTGWMQISGGALLTDALEAFNQDFEEKLRIVAGIESLLQAATHKQLAATYSQLRDHTRIDHRKRPILKSVHFSGESISCDARHSLPIAVLWITNQQEIGGWSVEEVCFDADRPEEFLKLIPRGKKKIAV